MGAHCCERMNHADFLLPDSIETLPYQHTNKVYLYLYINVEFFCNGILSIFGVPCSTSRLPLMECQIWIGCTCNSILNLFKIPDNQIPTVSIQLSLMTAFSGVWCWLVKLEPAVNVSIETKSERQGFILAKKVATTVTLDGGKANSFRKPSPIHRSQVFSWCMALNQPTLMARCSTPAFWPWVSCSNMSSVDPWCTSRPAGTQQRRWRTLHDEWTAECQSQLTLSCPAWRTSR